jgi:hypothetical protein
MKQSSFIKLLPFQVAPGITAMGYYPYRTAIIWHSPMTLSYSWQARDPQEIEVRELLKSYLNRADLMHRESQKSIRDYPMGFRDNHMVMVWNMHGHTVYCMHTDGSVHIGLEVEERHW